MFNWTLKSFEQLSNLELFRMLELRTNIFVVEQNCPYPELDDDDLKCTHLLLQENDKIVGTARLFPVVEGKTKIGRVCLHSDYRGKGLAHELMINSIKYCQANGAEFIKISAQAHLEKFYQNHNFKTASDVYLEDGIPHIDMHLTI